MHAVALVVTYNRLAKLKNCLTATLRLPFDHIIIINNASSDGTLQWLKEQTDLRLHVVTTGYNLGGSGGFKYGANYVSEHIKTDWVFFYDDDAYPAADLFEQFTKLDKKNYHLFCSKVTLPSGEACQMNIPYKKIPKTICETLSYGLSPHKYIPTDTKQKEVATFSFVGAIIHQDILKLHANKIDERLFIYFDDVLFSHYLNILGHKILYVPELLFVHDTNIDTNINASPKIYYLVRNLLYLLNSEYPLFSRGATFIRITKIVLSCFLKKENFRALPYVFKGIFDGFLHNRNKNQTTK